MQSSSRIIKSRHKVDQSNDTWVIDTVLNDTEDSIDEELDESEEVKEAAIKRKKILNEAQSKKEEMIELAKKEAEEIKQQAYQTGIQSGKEAGYQEGYTQGMQEGYAEGKQESEVLKQQGRDLITAAQLEIEQYVQEKKDELLSLSLHMAEKIIHDQLDHADEGILTLVHPILHQLDREEDFISLTVHPDSKEAVKEQLTKLKEQYPGVRFSVLQDGNLEPNGCIVESAHKLIDLQVKAQLEAILKEMKETERNV
ncbi:FliH/SctL family protein [Marinilactibacillus psychrotolerans]|uniref:FliH/SctL family protein n=1 Tax=Marinilactibacillus psychrotolerans TaxID=191770 RepID=A0ABW8UP66_9LACT